jgi:hypothetical protein
LKIVQANYARAPYYGAHKAMIENWFRACETDSLSEINVHFISRICEFLGITTRLTHSMAYRLADGTTERLVSLCRNVGAGEYVSGPSARSYLNEALFDQAGIRLTYMEYSGYPEYPQPHPPFDHHVSVIDLILNTGRDATSYLLPL